MGAFFIKSLKKDFSKAGLPSACPYPVSQLAEAMGRDKKAENGIVHFVLPAAVGDVRICDMELSAAVRSL